MPAAVVDQKYIITLMPIIGLTHIGVPNWVTIRNTRVGASISINNIYIHHLQQAGGMDTEPEFDSQFNEAFDGMTQQLQHKYQKAFDAYREHIIPFQSRRMKENQNLSFKNTSLERDKMELLSKIERLSSENLRNEYVMETQLKKINELERTISELEAINSDNLSMIEALRMTNADQEESISEKAKIIKQIEQDKEQVLQDFHKKNDEYNSLLSAYMKDKNIIAEKLNYMNEMEQSLLDKDRAIKEQQFYLKKQWEEFEEAKKNQSTPAPSVIPNRIFNRKKPSSMEMEEQNQPEEKSRDITRNQILRTPVKKIIKHHQNEIYGVEFNYNGSMMATCGGDRQIKIYDVLNFKSGVTINSNSAESIFISVGLDYSGERLLAGSTDRSVQIFSTSTGKLLHSFVGHGYKINSVSWSSMKEKCVSGSEDKQIKVWEVEKAANLLSINSGKPVRYLHCNTVEPIVYSGHSDGSIRLYSINQGTTPIAQIKGIIDYSINSISLLSSRHQVLVSSQQGTTMHLLDLKMNKSVAKFEHKQFCNTVVRADISPSQNYVVAGNCDGYLFYWNKEKKSFERKVSGHQASITSLRYHFISSMLASCDKDGSVILWQ